MAEPAPSLPDAFVQTHEGVEPIWGFYKICVGVDGRVSQVTVVDAVPGADEVVVPTIREQWRYHPFPRPACALLHLPLNEAATRASRPPEQTPESEATGANVTDVVLSHQAEVSACVKAQLAAEPTRHGVVVMSWWIEPTGAVSDVQLVSEEFKGSVIAECLGTLLRALHFDDASKVREFIRYPFELKASSPPRSP